MEDVQTENYTKLSNDVLDETMKHRFNGTQSSLILAIWRYTFGFHREEHQMSIGFLEKATCCNRSQVDRELKVLIERKIITVVGTASRNSRILRFNRKFSEWINYPLNSGLSANPHTVLSANQHTDLSANPRYKKETIKQKKKEKHRYADTVLLTHSEYDQLVNDFGKEAADSYIEKLDEWQTNNPKKAKKDHNKTIRVWIKKDQEKRSFQTIGNGRANKQMTQNEQLMREIREEMAREQGRVEEDISYHQQLLPEFPD